MTTNGEVKSAALRDEVIRIDTVLAATQQDEAEAHAVIRGLVREAIRPDAGDALARIKQAEGKLGAAKMNHRRLLDARQEVEAELAAALAQEAQTEREKDAGEAEKYAQSLPNVFSECDRTFAEFHRCFSAAIAAVREGRLRGWNLPSEELMQAKLIRALKTVLNVGDLRMLGMVPLPSVERCTFESLGQAYAQSIRGGAKHSLMSPPAPPPIAQQSAARSEDFKLPPRGDVGMRFTNDPKEFAIRIPTGR
jgi:hypothetical protein